MFIPNSKKFAEAYSEPSQTSKIEDLVIAFSH